MRGASGVQNRNPILPCGRTDTSLAATNEGGISQGEGRGKNRALVPKAGREEKGRRELVKPSMATGVLNDYLR